MHIPAEHILQALQLVPQLAHIQPLRNIIDLHLLQQPDKFTLQPIQCVFNGQMLGDVQ